MTARPPEVSAWNLANGLTTLRLVLVPVFLVVLLHSGGHQSSWRIAACVVFGIASMTDRFDGEVARRRGLVTEFGKLADPIADKLLVGAALIALSALGDLSWWLTGIVLAREVGVTALRFWVIRRGVLAASRGGKAKTLLQSVAIGLYLLPLPAAGHWVAFGVMLAGIVVALVTAADYVLRAQRMRHSG